MEKQISYEEHSQIIYELEKKYEKNMEQGFEEAYEVVREAQSQLDAERKKVNLFKAIAYLEKAYSMPEIDAFQDSIRTIINSLWKKAEMPQTEGIGIANTSKSYAKKVKGVTGEKQGEWHTGGIIPTIAEAYTGQYVKTQIGTPVYNAVGESYGNESSGMSIGVDPANELRADQDWEGMGKALREEQDELRPEYDLKQLKPRMKKEKHDKKENG